MTARLRELSARLVDFFRAQPPARRLVLASGVGSLVVVLALAWWVEQPFYRPLFTNLAAQDASAIVEALGAERVPFRLEDGGRAILVPAERLYELRLALASRGLPEGGGVGFELFDRQTLGQTDFLQRLNYQRALQGELGRTISRLGGVESARVHLALPERSLLVGEDRRPSASVVVKLAPGHALSAAQIDGIVHLVAASVEGLAADGVTVVDEGGRMLTTDRRGGETVGAWSGALEMQASIERQLAERVESMLAAVVGRDKAVARVAATLEAARVERTEETYDPERTALRTQRTTREQTTGARTGGGASGVESNLTNDPEPEGPRTERRDESQSYEVSKVVSHTVAPAGVVKQLSVAVLIDGTYTGAGAARKFTPRPAEELARLKELVKNAVGFSEARGDRIEITSVPFQSEPAAAGEGVLAALDTWLPALLRARGAPALGRDRAPALDPARAGGGGARGGAAAPHGARWAPGRRRAVRAPDDRGGAHRHARGAPRGQGRAVGGRVPGREPRPGGARRPRPGARPRAPAGDRARARQPPRAQGRRGAGRAPRGPPARDRRAHRRSAERPRRSPRRRGRRARRAGAGPRAGRAARRLPRRQAGRGHPERRRRGGRGARLRPPRSARARGGRGHPRADAHLRGPAPPGRPRHADAAQGDGA